MNTVAELVCVSDYKREAKRRLAKDVYDFASRGAMDEHTLEESRHAFRRYHIRPRYLRNIGSVDLSTTMLGQKVSLPFGVAPIGMQKLFHSDGDIATSKAAGAVGAAFTLSTVSSFSIEKVAKENPNQTLFFQLYFLKDRDLTRSLVERAETCGYKAIVVTVDTKVVGVRYGDMRNKFALPRDVRMENLITLPQKTTPHDSSTSFFLKNTNNIFCNQLTWQEIQWVKSLTKLPLVVKGLLTAEDALEAAENGVDAVWVSTHGGRQLDSVVTSLDALPEIVSAIGDRMEVYIDGGFRSGTDIFKALALGANMVFMGRPLVYGIACGGEEGATRVLKLLREELNNVMTLAGISSIEHLRKENSVLKTSPYFHKL